MKYHLSFQTLISKSEQFETKYPDHIAYHSGPLSWKCFLKLTSLQKHFIL